MCGGDFMLKAKLKNIKLEPKTKKRIKISAIAIVVCIAVIFGTFFSVFPMNPKVEIASADGRVSDNSTVVVASYNTAAPWGNLIQGTHSTRRAALFAKQVNELLPDVIGVQEINSKWVEKMEKYLPQYTYYGVERGGDENDNKSEMNGIFYLKDKYSLEDSGTFWLSETPKVASKYKDAGCNRIASYVILKNKSTGELLAHYNTHLDNASKQAQDYGIVLIMGEIQKMNAKYGEIFTIVTGDFNQYEYDLAVNTVCNYGFYNANGDDNQITYHDWGKREDGEGPIDFILTNNKNIQNYTVHNEKIDRSYVSDHYMISVEIKL